MGELINAAARFELRRIQAAGDRAFPKLQASDFVEDDMVWDEAQLHEAMRLGFGFGPDAKPALVLVATVRGNEQDKEQ